MRRCILGEETMNRLTTTNDITDYTDEVIVPRGTILERVGDRYEGRNPLTGVTIQMDASWADDEVYYEYFTKEGDGTRS